MNIDNLHFYERLGYAITIKRVFKFEKEYISKNTSTSTLPSANKQAEMSFQRLFTSF
jgi:hypothetical protein